MVCRSLINFPDTVNTAGIGWVGSIMVSDQHQVAQIVQVRLDSSWELKCLILSHLRELQSPSFLELSRQELVPGKLGNEVSVP